VTKPPVAVLPWVFILFSGLAIVSLWRVPRWVRLGITSGIATVLLLIGMVVWQQPDKLAGFLDQSGHDPSQDNGQAGGVAGGSAPSSAPPSVDPSPVTALNRSVLGCRVTVTFQGTPPPDWTYVLANQAPGQSSIYLTGEVQHDQRTGEWTGFMNLDNKDTPNMAFRMYVVAMPTSLAMAFRYVRYDRNGEEQRYWYQKEWLPAYERVVSEFVVNRDDRLDNC